MAEVFEASKINLRTIDRKRDEVGREPRGDCQKMTKFLDRSAFAKGRTGFLRIGVTQNLDPLTRASRPSKRRKDRALIICPRCFSKLPRLHAHAPFSRGDFNLDSGESLRQSAFQPCD